MEMNLDTIGLQGYQASPQQARHWRLDAATGNRPFRSSIWADIEGPLTFQRFLAAFWELFQRHQVLRTRYVKPPEMATPLQVIADMGWPAVSLFDLDRLPTGLEERVLQSLVERIEETELDPDLGPLISCFLIRMASDRHRLYLCSSALCVDSPSLVILARKLGESCGREIPSLSSEEPLQYLAFSEWQNELLEDEEAAIGRSFWRERKATHLRASKFRDLPPDSAKPCYRPGYRQWLVGLDLVERMRSRFPDASLDALLLTCWLMLLQRSGEGEAPTVGVAFDGRIDEALFHALGPFVRYLPVSCPFEERLPFSAAMERVRQALGEADEWQEFFEWDLIAEPGPEVGSPAQFTYGFDFESKAPDYEDSERRWSFGMPRSCPEPFLLRLTCILDESRLHMALCYDKDAVSGSEAQRWARRVDTLLRDVVDRGEAAIDAYRILDACERDEILVGFNNNRADFPRDRCLHQLFEERAARPVDATAAVLSGNADPERCVTYRELERRSNRLARYLRRLGIGPDGVVAIAMEQSPDMLVALLGVLKAGGAYLPLDPGYPTQRLAYMIDEARPAVLLTHSALLGQVPKRGPRVVALNGAWKEIADEPASPLATGALPENLAYIIYTSGSTGRPKGVMMPHRAICNHMFWMLEVLPWSESERVLQRSSFSFEVSVWEFFLPLLMGRRGRLVMAASEAQRDTDALARLIAVQEVTAIQIVPSLLSLLLESGNIRGCSSLKRVFVGGEILTPALRDRFFAKLEAQLFNLYGPTETCIDATIWRCRPGAEVISVGKPITNTRAHILDGRLRPLPIGATGKIFIGGAGISRGYCRSPVLTAGNFLPDPLSGEIGSRLYRTGDVARYMTEEGPDWGAIEFLGRKDHQVKIRGFRIELGEIESVLEGHERVDRAALLVRQDRPDDPRLVAYIVTSGDGPAPGYERLREFLARHLPDYMLPVAWVTLDRFPLTPNGKLDRGALPPPQETGTGESVTAPRTLTETLLTSMWRDVLARKHIGIEESFFELGGHSLLSARVISRIRKVFEVELPIQGFFENPTIAQLAAEVDRLRRLRLFREHPLVPVPRSESLPLSFAQQRLWFLAQMEGSAAPYHMSSALVLEGPLDIPVLLHSLRAVVRRHEVLRTFFPSVSGKPVQTIVPEARPRVILMDLTILGPWVEPSAKGSGQDLGYIRDLVIRERKRGFELAADPPFRVLLVKLGPRSHIFQITMHHIVSDGWSLGIFVREITMLYRAFRSGQPPPLPDLPIQYADFAHWQRQWLKGEVLAEQLEFWRKQLAELPPTADLLGDYPKPEKPTFEGATHAVALTHRLSEGLASLSRAQGVTHFMTFLAAFRLLLYRLSGRADLPIGVPIANRTRVETEGLVGCFLNTLVFRTRITNNPSFLELLHGVKGTALDAFLHQDIPFEMLVAELQPERSLNRPPFFDILFNFTNTPAVSEGIAGLSISSLDLEAPEAPFGLALYLGEQNDVFSICLLYQREVFSPGRIAVLLEQLTHLLERIVADPRIPADSYSLVTPGTADLLPDPSQLLSEPAYEPIPSLFSGQVGRTPESIAVGRGFQEWNYREVGRTAMALVLELRTRGILPGETVAVIGERCFGVITATMGVLSSGAVLLTLDPTLPKARLRTMLREAETRCLIAVGESLTHGSELTEGLEVISMDLVRARLQDLGEPAPKTLRPSAMNPDDPAYVFFTSGTTGRPKGILGCHKGLAHFIHWQRQTFGVGPGDRCAQLTGLSFDVVLRDIFLPLSSGATLCLPPTEVESGSERVLCWLEKERISLLHTVPSLAQAWLAAGPTGLSLNGLRWIFFAGEPLPGKLVNDWREELPQSGRIANFYGPTETTLAKCWHEVGPEPLTGSQPVGLPLPETQALVLNRVGVVCGIGEPGEIVIRTPFRTLGYLGDSGSGNGFVPNPFTADSRDLLYRTGDRGCYRPDGTLAILGRLDDRIKLQGVRIEPAEIESELHRHPGIRKALVMIRNDRLTAYLLTTPEAGITPFQLRNFLKQRLPLLMIPVAWVFLEAFPLTANGKVDREGLPDPSPISVSPKGYAAPRTPLERRLAAIWQEVLRLERVGRHDDFFAMGGHSLLATQVIARIREALDVDLGVRVLFEHATLEALAEAVATAQLQRSPKIAPFESLPRTQPLPLSFAQQRLWFLDQLEGPSATYNIPFAVRLEGLLDLRALTRSLEILIHRHESLRTGFVREGDDPVQVIARAVALRVPVPDLRALCGKDRERVSRELVRQEGRAPFDLTRPPLIRTILLYQTDRTFTLLLTVHHIVSDGWSMGILLSDLVAIYRAERDGLPAELPELPFQFADFAFHQRRDSRAGDASLTWWREVLAGAPPMLRLPTRRSRPQVQRYRGAVAPFELSKRLTDELDHLSRRHRASLFMTLLAGFKILLARYSGQRDILIGTPVANRARPELERLIGLFINTIVLRTDLSGDPSFETLLGRVRGQTLDAFSHQQVPFERLVDELRPVRALSHSPLFQVMFVHQNLPAAPVRLPELAFIPVRHETGTAKFDITLSLTPYASGLMGSLEYDTDLFDRTAMDRLAGHYRRLLEGMVADPGRTVFALPMLSPGEVQALLHEWNATGRDFASNRCIHRLIEERVRRTPESQALCFGGWFLTYGALNDRANRLAHRLRDLGAGPETRIGICLERSLEMVIGLLAILKAGGVYVPIEPAYPPERIRFLMEDAGIAFLLTMEPFLKALPPNAGQVVVLDRPGIWEEPGRDGDPNPEVGGHHAAYMIYTSGSTGLPKGTLVSHGAIRNRLLWMQDVYGLGREDRVLQKTPYSFDVSVWEFFWPLLRGASLVIARPDGHRDPAYLGRLVGDSRVTTLHFVPSMLQVFLNEPDLGDLGDVRRVFCSGEALSPSLQARFFERFGAAALHNLYGPTEAAVDVSFWRCYADPDCETVPIGRPIANIRLYLFDFSLRPVPAGIVGELLIGGVGLAQGYHRRPSLSAEKFVPDPVADRPGERLYRTGDLARHLADGAIAFIGRRDHQVKIRGFRVELGEVASVLSRHPEIRTAAVQLHEERAGRSRLIAYVVPRDGAHANRAETEPVPSPESMALRDGEFRGWREFLKERLPEYMVPATFIPIADLPLTPNGKIDYAALPKPDRPRQSDHTQPGTPLEELLAGIFSEILGVEPLGIHESFFELGGDSLMVTRVVARMKGSLDKDASVRDLFDTPTVAGLAEKLGGRPVIEDRRAFPLRAVSRSASLPLSFAQQRLWFLDQLEGPSPTYNMPTALRLEGRLDIGGLAAALQAVSQRHETLRTGFPQSGGKPMQQIAPRSLIVLHLVDLTASLDARELISDLADRHAAGPFDLAHGPLFRNCLLRFGESLHFLLICMHHIVSDGWSTGVLVRELTALYRAFSEGRDPALPELPVQYADFACWQRQWLRDDRLERQLGYWKRRLAGCPPQLNLPTDRVRPNAPTFAGAELPIALPAELGDGLRALRRSHGVTMFMALLANFAVLLSRYSGQANIVVGTPIANRTRPELEGLIGFFANTLALNTELAPNDSFASLLAQVRERTLEAYTHQDIPFEQVVEALVPERSLTRNPLFQVMLILQNTPMETVRLRHLTLSPVIRAQTIAKFDLTLSFVASPQGLFGSLQYNTDLFDRTTMARFAEHFKVLLAGAVTDQSQAVRAMSPFASAELHRQLVAWNAFPLEVPRRCLHDHVEAQAAKSPEAIAVKSGDGRQALTYDRHLREANRLARELREMGVGPDIPVGLCLPRSLDMAIGAVAVLKAGGVYVPIDPQDPKSRIDFILKQAQARVVLTWDKLRPILPIHGVRVLCMDRDLDFKRRPGTPPRSPVQPENLAYIIFTSGTTGRPKGVAMPHRPLLNLVAWHLELWNGPSITLQFATLSFDMAFQEMFTTWCSGGSLILVTEEERRDPACLASLIEREAVTRAFFPVVAFRQLMEQGTKRLPFRLKQIVTSGEQLQIDTRIRQRFADGLHCRLYNQYGPAESHVVTAHTLEKHPDRWPDLPLIGRPLANCRIYILAPWLKPLPVGAIGEVYVGGVAPARGYIHQSVLTARRFLPDPFGNLPGGRMYRSGDLARFQPDGPVRFMGRLDHQVKIRGFRVEPAEIKVVLEREPSIRNAVVVAGEGSSGRNELTAYIVMREGSRTPVSALREHVKRSLPAYMVPSAFVVLDALPLSATGKIDYKALPKPDRRARVEDEAVAPMTPTQAVLVPLWCGLLGLRRVGIHDNFFLLGGHSLMATQLVSRVRDTFAVELPVRKLFESPTIQGLADEIDRVRRSEVPTLSSLVPAGPRPERIPLSFAQQRLWFLNQLEGPSATYNINVALRLLGGLSTVALNEAFREIVRRHETLRTELKQVEGVPVQVIRADIDLTVKLIDLSRLRFPSKRQTGETWAREIAHREARRFFDLSQAPLLRLVLIRLSEDDHLQMVTMHHIISDGWSLGILAREFATLYKSFSRAAPSPLEPLPIQYADFSLWQQKLLRGEIFERQRSYWRNRLKGLPPLLELPTDRARPPVLSYRGAVKPFSLSPTLTEALIAVSHGASATLFMTLISAFSVLLARYSGQTDIAVGSMLANRTRSELESLIGFFVNAFVLRSRVVEGSSFRDFLAEVKTHTLDAYAHQDIPFEQLVNSLQPVRSLSHTPLFQVVFVLQNATSGTFELPGLRIETVPQETGIAKFDLAFFLQETSRGLYGVLEYSTALFDEPTIERILEHYRNLLTSIVGNPDGELFALPMMAEPERRQLMETWNDTRVTFPQPHCLHELFLERVAGNPGADAVFDRDLSIGYGVLCRQAISLAHALRKLGARPNHPVAVVMEKGWTQVAAVLGILASGAAYLPIDPSWPEKRRALMLALGEVTLAVTDDRLGQELEWPEDLRTLCLPFPDRAPENIERHKPSRRPAGSRPEDLAYVIFTSGSTGVPKGVAVEHRAAANTLHDINSRFGVRSQDRVFAISSLSFDLSVYDIFGVLAAGGALVIPEEAHLKDPGHWAELMGRHRVTIWDSVPALMQILVDYLETHPDKRLDSLRLALLSGDWIPLSLPKRMSALIPHLQTIGMGGATEASIWSIFHPITKVEPHWKSIPYGRPLANQRFFVLNPGMEPCPPGVTGELYIGGVGLAQGYWHDETRTKASFVKHPLTGERLYRTGDLGRYMGVEGNHVGPIEILGRADFQVKVNGYRIELGEIETVLRQHPAVMEAVAVAREDRPSGKRISAYIQLGDPSSSGKSQPVPEPVVTGLQAELKTFASTLLPDYMVPSTFVFLKNLPLTPNGKVDRQALPEPEDNRVVTEARIPPGTFLERKLAGIWEDLLETKPIGVSDNFFDLGGNSLMAVQLTWKIKRVFGISFPIVTLLEGPTVRNLARLIEAGDDGRRSALVNMQPRGTKPPLFCVHGGGGSALNFTNLVDRLGEGQPFFAFQPKGLYKGEHPQDRLNEMARCYLRELLEAQPRGPHYLTGWSFGGLVAFEMARLLEKLGETPALVMLLDTPSPERLIQSARAERLDDEILFFKYLVEKYFGVELTLTLEELRRSAPRERLRHAVNRAEQAGLLPTEADEEDLERILELHKAHFRAALSYKPSGTYPGKVVLFRTRRDSDRVSASPGQEVENDSTLGWEKIVDGEVTVRHIPGNHHSIMHEPHVAVLAKMIHETLAATT